jgi:hypothetical protein
MPSVLQRFPFKQVGITLLLLLLAIAQGIYVARHSIAEKFPNTRASLSLACTWLDQHGVPCKLEHSRDLQKMSIEDTALLQSKTRSDVIKLSGAISNHGNDIQAYPNLELNLTNAQNIVVLRRYLRPYEYVEMPETGIAPMHTFHFSIGLIADGLLDGVTVTGYHIKISY